MGELTKQRRNGRVEMCLPVHSVIPFREGETAIPFPAHVVRTDAAKNSFRRAVAVLLDKELRGARGAGASSDRKE